MGASRLFFLGGGGELADDYAGSASPNTICASFASPPAYSVGSIGFAGHSFEGWIGFFCILPWLAFAAEWWFVGLFPYPILFSSRLRNWLQGCVSYYTVTGCRNSVCCRCLGEHHIVALFGTERLCMITLATDCPKLFWLLLPLNWAILGRKH